MNLFLLINREFKLSIKNFKNATSQTLKTRS